MAYNSDGYIMIDFTEVDFRRTNQTIDGLYKRCVDVIGTNKFILVINANGRTPLPATCSFTNNQYVIDTCIYMFAISSNDNLFIRRNDVPASDIIDDDSVSVDKTWSSNKINTELSGKQDTLTAGANITIDENNVISSTGGAVIDDNVIVNNKVWSSLNTVEKLAPVNTVIGNPATFKTSLEMPLVECITNFQATQSGSGEPAYNNVRPIIGFSNSTFTYNGNTYFIDFNGEKFGGYIDFINKKVVFDVGKFICDGTNITWSDNGNYFRSELIYNMAVTNKYPSLCNWLKTATIAIGSGIYVGSNSRRIYIGYGAWTPIEVTNFNEWNAYLQQHNLEFTYPLATPIEISLTDLPTLITQVGENSFASDIGSIKVSYKCFPTDLL